jgi:hypothetical protein
MIFPEKIGRRLSAQPLTRARIALALGIAVAADGLQMLLGPFGWVGVDQVIDVAAMVLTTLTLGFHPLLLPTFVVEFIPPVDMLPTWTGCVIAVIALRKRAQRGAVPPIISSAEPPKPKDTPVIDI